MAISTDVYLDIKPSKFLNKPFCLVLKAGEKLKRINYDYAVFFIKSL